MTNEKLAQLRRSLRIPFLAEDIEELLPPDFNDFLRERAYVAENQRPDYKSPQP